MEFIFLGVYTLACRHPSLVPLPDTDYLYTKNIIIIKLLFIYLIYSFF